MRWPRSGDARPGVTVVIPCYNYGRYLDAATGAVLAQPDVEPRVIIVDDASTDGSLDTALRIAERDERVTVISHTVNAGHIATYNDGLAAVSTEFVSLVSADDLVAPGALARASRLMLAEPSVGMVYGRPLEFGDDGPPPVPERRRANWTVWRGREWIAIACWRGRSFILSPEVVMRTEAMREVGPYNPALPHSGDLEYWLRTAARWDVARVNGPVQAEYRVHDANMHLTTFAGMAEDLRHRALAFRGLSEPGTCDELPRHAALVARAERSIAREALLLAQRELDRGGDVDAASELFRVAGEVRRSSLRGRRGRAVVRRLRRAHGGASPDAVHRGLEAARRQLDRVRWTVWRHLGVS
ncbi:glycosyltransferase family 2 protein [Agromyces allii]|uniref:glycosyltransferase family 2 protein n=1 Tax=Agromyces allii TaxID=393607 RepID=UPI0014791584|nr:glycosyltransferase [Agromyces allii]